MEKDENLLSDAKNIRTVEMDEHRNENMLQPPIQKFN